MKNPGAFANTRSDCDDDQALLMRCLAATPGEGFAHVAARPWAPPARLRPVTTHHPVARRTLARPLVTATALLLAGSLGIASMGIAPVRAEPSTTAPLLAPAPVGPGVLADLQFTAMLAQLLATPVPPRAEQDLLTDLLASAPPAAPPAAVSFATVVRLPAAAYSYNPTVVQLPMIALADNVPPPPPAPPAQIVAAQQPPPPPGYVQPPGYQDGVPFGGQIGAVPRLTTPKPVTPKPVTVTPKPVTTWPTTYVVRVGDTLSSIALAFYGDVAYAPAIWEANAHLIGGNLNLIFAGDRLILPVFTLTRPVSTGAVALPARGPISQKAAYTIQPSDFLRWMAQRAYGTEGSWPTIYNANRKVLGSNPDLIYPQVTVYIP